MCRENADLVFNDPERQTGTGVVDIYRSQRFEKHRMMGQDNIAVFMYCLINYMIVDIKGKKDPLNIRVTKNDLTAGVIIRFLYIQGIQFV
jgi:hypothetical protein